MKALLIVWMGFGQGEVLTITDMASPAACEAAVEAMLANPNTDNLGRRAECVSYAFQAGQ